MSRMDYERGMLVRSKAGHDKKGLFVIIKEDGDYLYLVDGIKRTIEHPKRKSKKHVQIIHKKFEKPEWTDDAIGFFILRALCSDLDAEETKV